MTGHDIIIIGAGPSGLTAAMQLCRYGLAPLVFESEQVGGLLRNANWVENYPGFPAGIPGIELVQRFDRQARRLGVQIVQRAVEGVSWDGAHFSVQAGGGHHTCRVLVIASGTRPRSFNDFHIPTELNERIGYEVYPILSLEGQLIAIVGAGDAAFDYALNLHKKNDVVILNRGTQRRCLPLLWQRASASGRIVYYENTRILEIAPARNGRMRLKCESYSPGRSPADPRFDLQVDYLLGALGREPCLDFTPAQFLESAPELERRGLLYFIGDVKNGLYRQTAIAAGDGLRAAMQIYHLLKE